ncbi:hypothetical protein [Granulicella sp. L46]|uniref:hypothetical protein n=1 Tax=Granulicella sp. L46 TaxID=1641865 RepID=UPI00131A7B59|nr:hypothetical protein [Granulicella sp. L46]
MSELPQTAREVKTIIVKAERSRKYVWTAGRVLIEGGCAQLWKDADARDKKEMLKRITALLENLASEGILARRPLLQGIGYGQEKGFDFISTIQSSS